MAPMNMIEKGLRWIVIGVVFCLPIIPFIVSNSLFFPYITGKNFTFRILVELMGGAWLALALVVPAYRPRRSWVLGLYALFVFLIGIADFFGAYPEKSIWSNYERMEGWVTLAHLVVYLVVAAAVMNTENLWRRLFQVSLVASILISLRGFMQFFGFAALDQGGASGLTGRIDATFGNPIYLAAYMLFHIFIAAMLWMQMRHARNKKEQLWPAVFYCTTIILDTLALAFSGTRGTILGLIGGAFLTLILLSLAPGAKRLRSATIGAFVVLLIAGGGLFMARNTSLVHSVGFLDRLASISLSDSTTMARFLNMGIAWQGVKERPILGWGQENYALVFDKYYDPRMYAQEQWFDRVHNSIFDWWIAGGTIGLLAFLSVFAGILWVLWRPLFGWKGTDAFTHEEKSLLTGLIAGYFFHNLTVFDNITSSILFVTILGYIIYREVSATHAKPVPTAELMPQSTLGFVGAATLILAFVSMYAINSNAIAANKALIGAIQQQPGGVTENLSLFQKALSYNSFGNQEIREQLAQITPQVLAADSVPNDLKQQFLQLTVSEFDKQAAASPLDARFPLFAAGVLDAGGLYKDAATYYEKAHELSPKKQTILYQMGQNALVRGDNDTAVKDFAEAYNDDTSNLNAHLYYAAILIRVGREKEADAILAPLIPTGDAANQQIASAYASRGEFTKLIPIWKAHIAASPSDSQSYVTLAAAYYGSGDLTDAITTLQKAASIDPSMKSQTDTLIQQMKSGTLKI